jgi:hypothetical protein
VLVGPSPLLGVGAAALGRAQLLAALVLLGVGEACAMTPVLDALIGASGGGAGEAAVNALSGAMAAAFALGQCVGPLLGSSGGARFGLDWVTTAVAIVVVACAAAVGGMGAAPDAVQRRLML